MKVLRLRILFAGGTSPVLVCRGVGKLVFYFLIQTLCVSLPDNVLCIALLS